MGLGVVLLLLFIGLSLGSEVTTTVQRAGFVVFIVAIAALAAGLVLYGLSRAAPP